MARMVFCRRLKKELPGLDAPPFPGPRGQEIFENVSKEAWAAWLEHQTMVINEHQLNMLDKDARKFLNGQMERFLNGEEVAHAEGYIPPKPDRSDDSG